MLCIYISNWHNSSLNHQYLACNQCLKALSYIMSNFFLIGAPRRMPFFCERISEGYWDLLVIWVIGMNLHIEKVLWQIYLGRSWSYLKKYNIIFACVDSYLRQSDLPHFSDLHIYMFIYQLWVYVQFVFMPMVCVFCSQSGSENWEIFWINHDVYQLAAN
jgi:hypothetical protein